MKDAAALDALCFRLCRLPARVGAVQGKDEEYIGDIMSPWITPLPILNVPEKIYSPSVLLTLAGPFATEHRSA